MSNHLKAQPSFSIEYKSKSPPYNIPFANGSFYCLPEQGRVEVTEVLDTIQAMQQIVFINGQFYSIDGPTLTTVPLKGKL